jgi:uncharacterized iron-regulated membrane protein
VHLWVGIATGLYVFVVCVTGAALVFHIDMQRALFPQLFPSSGGAPPADAATVLETVRDAFPNDRISGIDAPTTTRSSYLAYVINDDTFQTLLLDPRSGRLLGELPNQSILRQLRDLHVNLLSGRVGRVANGLGAVCLAVMALTGVIIWWPGIATWPRALTIDPRRSWRRINFDLHRAVGFWASAFVVMWAVTALNFLWPQPFRSVVRRISPITDTGAFTSRVPAEAPTRTPWRTILDTARAAVPGAHVARVVVPSSDTAAFLVMFSAVQPRPGGIRLTSVYLDQYSGEVLQVLDASNQTVGDTIMAWVAPLHIGNFGGNGIRVAWFVLGLTPPLLFVTGFIMWWTRVIMPRRRDG